MLPTYEQSFTASGTSKDIEAYVQESGHCRRDGKHSRAILYLSKVSNRKGRTLLLSHQLSSIVLTPLCTHAVLMSKFAAEHHISQPHPLHICCDVRHQTCNCDLCQQMEVVITEDDYCEIQAVSQLNHKVLGHLLHQEHKQVHA